MQRDAIKEKLSAIMCELFRRPAITITDAMTAADVPGWDSLAHMSLVVAVEKGFGITLTTREIRGMKNVGALLDIIEKKAP
jgi:acyl carrier protein